MKGSKTGAGKSKGIGRPSTKGRAIRRNKPLRIVVLKGKVGLHKVLKKAHREGCFNCHDSMLVKKNLRLKKNQKKAYFLGKFYI